MEQKYLIDTNVVIGFMGKSMNENGLAFVRNLPPQISVITQIELLGWYKITPDELEQMNSFIKNSFVYALTAEIVETSIRLRQQQKIKTPDAILAATALVFDLTLVTRNVADFKMIPGIVLFNPFEL